MFGILTEETPRRHNRLSVIIRPENQEKLSQYMMAQFIQRMSAHLRRTLPDQTRALAEEDLKTFVGRSIRWADQYEIRDEFDVRRFLEHRIRFGSEFESGAVPWAARILQCADLTGAEKMNAIDDY